MINVGTKEIITDRLILRRFRQDDVHDVYNNWGYDSNVTNFISSDAQINIEFTKSMINNWISDYNLETFYHWAIVLIATNEVIGSIAVVSLDIYNKACELGYFISQGFRNNGYMTEALAGVIDFLFINTNVNRISAQFDTNNPASGRVMQKANMKYEGTRRQAKIVSDEIFCDLSMYAIIREEWYG